MYNRPASLLCVLMISSFFVLTVSDAQAEDWSPLWSAGTLSQGRTHLAATSANGKVFFAGGEMTQSGYRDTNVVDIFDTANNSWSTANLSQPRKLLSAASSGNKVFFGGGDWTSGGNEYSSNVVDVYDTLIGEWSTAALSQARGMLTAVGAGDKVFFAGGYGVPGIGKSDRVDVFDATDSSWQTAALSQRRSYAVSAEANGKVLFAGGINAANAASDVVDILDTSTGSWSTAHLSQARGSFAATATGNKVFFAGGGYNVGVRSNRVDIFDTTSNSWSTASLSQARVGLSAASVGTRVLFAGGSNASSSYSSVVDIYDSSTGIWTTSSLSQARQDLVAATVGNKVFFGGGGADSNVVDIYTLQKYDAITSGKVWTLVDQTTIAGRMQLNSGASLNLDGYNLTVGSMGGVALINLSTHTLTVGTDNSDCAYSGQITGSGSLVKAGSGKLTLTAANNYTGPTTIGIGSLVINGSLAPASAVTVQQTGTLGGIGSVGSVSVSLGGHIAPGDLIGSIGVLTLGGNLSLSHGALLDFDLASPSISDLISMQSFALLLDNQEFSDFTFTSAADFGPGVYTLIDAGNIQGSLDGNLSGTIGGWNASISTSGGDLVLTVVPEPSTFVLLGIGAFSFLGYWWHWRRIPR
jgi:autotransporter-associated beta strand protein